MKGKDWKFDKYNPDVNDIDARNSALTDYTKIVKDLNSINNIELFSAAFIRGIKWAMDKYAVRKLQLLKPMETELDKEKPTKEDKIIIDKDRGKLVVSKKPKTEEKKVQNKYIPPIAKIKKLKKLLTNVDFKLKVRENKFECVFVKKNGEERTLLGTINKNDIPKKDLPKGQELDGTIISKNIRVYDLENKGWRTIIIETIKSLSVIEDVL